MREADLESKTHGPAIVTAIAATPTTMAFATTAAGRRLALDDMAAVVTAMTNDRVLTAWQILPTRIRVSASPNTPANISPRLTAPGRASNTVRD